MKRRILMFVILLCITRIMQAQIPVTDVGMNAQSRVNQIVNYSTWTETLKKAITQANTLTTTLKYVQSVSSAVRDIAYTKELIERQGRIVKTCNTILKKPKLNNQTYRNLSSNVTQILATNNQLITLANNTLTGSFKMNDSERMLMLKQISEEQQKIMDEKINEYEKQGYSAKEAKKRAEKYVAIPDTSEHQLGLSVDINADTDKCSSEKVYQWLDENAYKYGFVKRYPEDKTDITGISNEPWHYRYVGVEAAKSIKSVMRHLINGLSTVKWQGILFLTEAL